MLLEALSWAGLRQNFEIVEGSWFRFGGGFEVQGLQRLVTVLGQVLVTRGFGGWFEWHMHSLQADRVCKQQVRVGLSARGVLSVCGNSALGTTCGY